MGSLDIKTFLLVENSTYLYSAKNSQQTHEITGLNKQTSLMGSKRTDPRTSIRDQFYTIGNNLTQSRKYCPF